MITYTDFLGGTYVKLDGKTVGNIVPVPGGYQYQPRGSKLVGEVFATVDEVKASLEGDA